MTKYGLTATAMRPGAVAFGDGIEGDHLVLDRGQGLTATTAERTLNLVAG